MDYETFIASKALAVEPAGIDDPPDVSESLFPFQRDIVRWALQRGRAAIFADTGLGKTRMQLEWAKHVAAHTGGRVLILAPLAVAAQTVREGKACGVEVTYARAQEDASCGITITNYEMLAHFDPTQFAGVVLDESSILKAYSGKVKRRLVESFARTPFRLACTATPAPNDHLELGNHAEFLGVMTSHEMIARWFLPDTSTFGTYRLKGHAVDPFWDWVSSWARCVGKPSDLGYQDEGFSLPELRTRRHVLDVDVTVGRGARLFREPDMSATSVHQEKRLTAGARAAKVAEIVAAEPDEPWIIWAETDYEADALLDVIPDAVEVRGSDPTKRKEDAALWFCGEPCERFAHRRRVLISKAKIFGWGMNWQHCARVAFVGPTFSYEQFYQAIRRSWRYRQTRAVDVHIVMAQTEVDVWSVLTRKAGEHEAMKAAMFAAAKRAHARHEARQRGYNPTHVGRLPAWMTSERRAA